MWDAREAMDTFKIDEQTEAHLVHYKQEEEAKKKKHKEPQIGRCHDGSWKIEKKRKEGKKRRKEKKERREKGEGRKEY